MRRQKTSARRAAAAAARGMEASWSWLPVPQPPLACACRRVVAQGGGALTLPGDVAVGSPAVAHEPHVAQPVHAHVPHVARPVGHGVQRYLQHARALRAAPQFPPPRAVVHCTPPHLRQTALPLAPCPARHRAVMRAPHQLSTARGKLHSPWPHGEHAASGNNSGGCTLEAAVYLQRGGAGLLGHDAHQAQVDGRGVAGKDLRHVACAHRGHVASWTCRSVVAVDAQAVLRASRSCPRVEGQGGARMHSPQS